LRGRLRATKSARAAPRERSRRCRAALLLQRVSPAEKCCYGACVPHHLRTVRAPAPQPRPQREPAHARTRDTHRRDAFSWLP
jgi:hypothetical protein